MAQPLLLNFKAHLPHLPLLPTPTPTPPTHTPERGPAPFPGPRELRELVLSAGSETAQRGQTWTEQPLTPGDAH